MVGRDLDPGQADITADFSNDTTLFSYGASRDPAQYDFTTVVLHEIAPRARLRRGDGRAEGRVRHRARLLGPRHHPAPAARLRPRTASPPPPTARSRRCSSLGRGSVALAAALTDGRSQWDGPAGKAANGGARPELYTPATWEPGSSYSHLDERHLPDRATPTR